MCTSYLIKAGLDRYMKYCVEDGSLWALDDINGIPFAGISSLWEWCRDELRAQDLNINPNIMLQMILDDRMTVRMSELYDWLLERYQETGHGGLF